VIVFQGLEHTEKEIKKNTKRKSICGPSLLALEVPGPLLPALAFRLFDWWAARQLGSGPCRRESIIRMIFNVPSSIISVYSSSINRTKYKGYDGEVL